MATATLNDTTALTAELVTARSASAGEPAFLTERRLKALSHYLATPVPGRRDEIWRRVELGDLKLDLAAVRGPTDGLLELSTPSAEARARQVFWGTAQQACADIPDVLQQHWDADVFPAGEVGATPSGNKFHSLNQALWDSGFVLHVPRGVEIELPARAQLRMPEHADAAFPHNLVVLEDGASATLIETYESITTENTERTEIVTGGGTSLPGQSSNPSVISVSSVAKHPFCCPQTEIILGQGARLRYILLQSLGPEGTYIGAHRAHQQAESKLTFVSAHLGARLEKAFMETRLLGPKAQAFVSGVYCGTGTQQLHLDTLQHHVAPECRSDLLFRGAMDGQAHGVYRGMIRVEPHAQKTDAYQQNRTLLLSGEGRMVSIPGLEILANDVRCSHGAAVGQIDPTMLFYLMSRGLDHGLARRMIVDGFLEEVILRFGLESVIEPLRRQIRAKLGHTDPQA
jgi:Fe-S cluster assembly protein SufD